MVWVAFRRRVEDYWASFALIAATNARTLARCISTQSLRSSGSQHAEIRVACGEGERGEKFQRRVLDAKLDDLGGLLFDPVLVGRRGPFRSLHSVSAPRGAAGARYRAASIDVMSADFFCMCPPSRK